MRRQRWMLLLMVNIFLILVIMSSATAQTTKATNPLILRAAMLWPPVGEKALFFKKACEEIERLTEGRVKVQIYWSDSLVKSTEVCKAIQRGICDIGWVSPAYHPAEVPLWGVSNMILYHPKNADYAWVTKKNWELIDSCKPLRDDIEKLGQIGWFSCAYGNYVLFSRKIVKNLEDMKGMRIRVSGEWFGRMVNGSGAHATVIPAPDTYTALDRGTIDGVMADWDMGKRYRFFEVVPQVIETNIFMMTNFINVSSQAIGKMSEKDRKTFLEVGRRLSIEAAEAETKAMEANKTLVRDKGVKILPFPNEEREKWAEIPAVKGLIKLWVDQQNAAGRPGTEVMRTFLKIYEVPQWMPPGY